MEKSGRTDRDIRDNHAPVSEEVKDEATGKTWAITLYHINEFGSVGERAILIAQDITKRVELEASLRQSEMMSLLGSLVAGVAHEVRNPLFGISSILDAFETRFSDRTEYLRYTNVLRDEIGRLTILMEELLEYGKPFPRRSVPGFDGRDGRAFRAGLYAGGGSGQGAIEQRRRRRVTEDQRSIAAAFKSLCKPDRKRDSAFAAGHWLYDRSATS